jgi:hypothetical protein
VRRTLHAITAICVGVYVVMTFGFLGWAIATGGPPPGVPMESNTMPWVIRVWMGAFMLGALSLAGGRWLDKREGKGW